MKLLRGFCSSNRWWNVVLGRPEVMELLKQALEDPDARIRGLAFQCLAGLAKHTDVSREAVLPLVSIPKLVSVLKQNAPSLKEKETAGELDPGNSSTADQYLFQAIREVLARLSASSTLAIDRRRCAVFL